MPPPVNRFAVFFFESALESVKPPKSMEANFAFSKIFGSSGFFSSLFGGRGFTSRGEPFIIPPYDSELIEVILPEKAGLAVFAPFFEAKFELPID